MTINDANHDEPLKLHSHRDLADDGTPKMTKAMEAYLDARRRADETKADGDAESGPALRSDLAEERRTAALARLERDHARLYGVIYLTDLRGLSMRATGRLLQLDHHTIQKHRAKALALVEGWCGEERQAG